MKRKSLLPFIVLLLPSCTELPTETREATPAFSVGQGLGGAIDGQYLVAFQGGLAPLNEEVNALGGAVVYAHARVGFAVVAGLTEEAAAQLKLKPTVRQIALDDETLLDEPGDLTVEAADPSVASAEAPQTSFFFARQWHLRAIGADQAWAAGRLGSPSVKVAILDTGLGYTHADLAGRVDLANSVSFVASDDALVQANFPGAHPVADLHYHGTHVGATVASNALAAAGVTSGVTLIGVKVCRVINLGTPQVNATCPTSSVLAGILHAADVGAHVANMSLGGTFNRRDASGGPNPSFIAIINTVFNYAKQKNLTMVVAAGNAAIDLDHNGNQYAAYCDAPHVICVSATGPTASGGVNGPWTDVDALAGYSNYGRAAVAVAAPGGTSPGLIWEACSTFSLVVAVCQTGTFIVGIGGTSMASPHTAGVAALIAEDVGRSPSKIRAKLLKTADDLGQPGTDPFYGAGRINALRAIQ